MTTLIQRSFSGGELTPALYARVDTTKYVTGLRTCRNHLVMRHGGAANRPGTEFVAQTKNLGSAVRLIKFVFNASQTYILEFGDEYMRVIRDGAALTETAKTITGVTQANPGVITSTAHGFSNDDEIFITAVGGMTELNGRNFLVANVTANTFTLKNLAGVAVNTTTYTAYTSGGTASRIYEIATPYAAADLATLQYIQSADVITIAHPSYEPRELSRTADTSWSLATLTFAPGIAAPTSPAVSGTGGTAAEWVVTAVEDETFEESLPSATVGGNSAPSAGSPRTITWAAVTGAREYNVYRSQNGVFGFIGVAQGLTFVDTGYSPDTSDTPPITRNPFNGANNYPSTVAYIQQRLGFANTNNNTEKVYLSRTGHFKNFTVSSPTQDDDAVTFTMAGRQVNAVKHLIDLGQLIVFTTGGEWAIEGDASGIIKPAEVNPKQHSYNGSSTLPPIIIAGNALYVQARGSVVRDLGFDYQIDGYRGNDLTVFSSHLFDGFELLDWDYQQIPHSVIWAARNDGTLLGCTYVREQSVLAWHRHDFEGGVVENVAVIPEGDEDRVYLVIKRTIDGTEVRYIERMATRRVDDIKDCIFLDSSLSYDGRNSDSSHTMTLSGGTDWTYDETLTLTSSDSFFISTDVGNQIHLTGSDGTLIRFTINAYTSGTVVTGKAHKTVPVAMRSIATSTWTRAVDEVRNLWHLEGQSVSILADGFVVANPNNEAYDEITVEDGMITLDKPYGVIRIGLPITSDLQTLDVDSAEGETLTDKKKNIGKVTVHVEESRGIWIGAAPPETLQPEGDDAEPGFLQGLTELKIRNSEGYDDPIDLKTEAVEVIIRPEWNSNGRVFIRQTDPLPLAILAVAPSGFIPVKR